MYLIIVATNIKISFVTNVDELPDGRVISGGVDDKYFTIWNVNTLSVA
jgi:hypothetical protein